jgi:hypothetical protein
MLRLPTLLVLAFSSLSAEVVSSESLLAQYRAARDAQPDAARVVQCEKVTLKRPAATLVLESGQLAFLPNLAGRPWAAVFTGEGVFRFAAASPQERAQTRRFNKKQEEVEEHFTEMTLYFSDETEQEILKQGKAASGRVEALASALKSSRETFRERLHSNEEAAVLRYLLRGEGAYFLALLKGKKLGTLLYEFAPADREEVSLVRVKDKDDVELWNSFSVRELGGEAAGGVLPKLSVDTREIALSTSVAGNATLQGEAKVEFEPLVSGERLVSIRLASVLRVSAVKDASGQALAFIQESEKRDGALWVFAPAPLEKGKVCQWQFSYAGKDVVSKQGDGNFFVGARSNWFPLPAVPGETFTDKARFRMTFRVPKSFTLVATGNEVSRKVEGNVEVTEWDSGRPVTVAGFNFGRFSVKSMEANGFRVSVYANSGLVDDLQGLKLALEQSPEVARDLGITPSALTTTGMSERAAAEGLNAMSFFSRVFGPLPDKFLRISQQPSGFFGQSWPGLLFMPYTSFLDMTARNQLGLNRGGTGRFLEEVGPHEIAHQWWGHAVAWSDYRDQWLSEGFAEYSAALFMESTKGRKALLNYMKGERDHILVSVGSKRSPNDAGPLSLGYRVGGEDYPGAEELMYAKGAYVLHMLRMMLHDYRTGGDSKFMEMMRDFVQTHTDQAASTEGFEAVVSKHFGRDMSFFFNQWVRNSALPKISGTYTVKREEGKVQLVVDARVTGVPAGFQVELPMSLRFKNGVSTGRLRLTAPGAPVVIGLPDAPEGVDFNEWLEVLGEIDMRGK